MERYEDRFYKYQTTARGLVSEGSLLNRFNQWKYWYNCLLQRFLPEGKNCNCLDLPCGYGNFIYFLRWKGYSNVKGYDLDPAQVKLAELLGLPAYVGNAFGILQNTSETFDVISSLDFIEHLSKDEALSFLDLCFERLIPGGILILRTPCADGPFGSHDSSNDITHRWSMTSNVLTNILMMVGFERVQILDEKPQPYKLVNVIRLMIYYPTLFIVNGICIGLGLGAPRIWSRSMWAIAYKPETFTHPL